MYDSGSFFVRFFLSTGTNNAVGKKTYIRFILFFAGPVNRKGQVYLFSGQDDLRRRQTNYWCAGSRRECLISVRSRRHFVCFFRVPVLCVLISVRMCGVFVRFFLLSVQSYRQIYDFFRTNICLLQTDVLNTVQHRFFEDFRRNLPSNPGFLCSCRLFLM